MCLTWTSRKLRGQKNELTRKGTLSPSMRILPLRTRTELLGGRLQKRDRILFTTKNDTFSRENSYFSKSEKNGFNWNLCSRRSLRPRNSDKSFEPNALCAIWWLSWLSLWKTYVTSSNRVHLLLRSSQENDQWSPNSLLGQSQLLDTTPWI